MKPFSFWYTPYTNTVCICPVRRTHQTGTYDCQAFAGAIHTRCICIVPLHLQSEARRETQTDHCITSVPRARIPTQTDGSRRFKWSAVFSRNTRVSASDKVCRAVQSLRGRKATYRKVYWIHVRPEILCVVLWRKWRDRHFILLEYSNNGFTTWHRKGNWIFNLA